VSVGEGNGDPVTATTSISGLPVLGSRSATATPDTDVVVEKVGAVEEVLLAVSRVPVLLHIAILVFVGTRISTPLADVSTSPTIGGPALRLTPNTSSTVCAVKTCVPSPRKAYRW